MRKDNWRSSTGDLDETSQNDSGTIRAERLEMHRYTLRAVITLIFFKTLFF